MKQKSSKVEVSEKLYIQISNVNKIRIAMEILRGVLILYKDSCIIAICGIVFL